MVLLPDPAGPSMAIRRGRCMRPPCFNERRYSEGLYHMLLALHWVCFERTGEACCGGALSTGVYGCSWFLFGFAVSFDSVGEFKKWGKILLKQSFFPFPWGISTIFRA